MEDSPSRNRETSTLRNRAARKPLEFEKNSASPALPDDHGRRRNSRRLSLTRLSLLVTQFSDLEHIVDLDMFERDTSGEPGFDYNWTQVPGYLRRPYILRHYRAHLGVKECLESLFVIHNETFDCWSHGLGALFFWAMSVYVPLSNDAGEFCWPIILYCVTHAMVFSVSLFAHTFNPINEKCFICCFQYDWSAIVIALFGGGVSMVSYLFYCYQFKRHLYSLLFAVPCVILFLIVNTHWFQTQDQVHKAPIAFFPFLVVVWIAYDAMHSIADIGHFIGDMYAPCLLLLVGMTIYATKVPERFSPGTFDLIFDHHTLHHLWTLCFAYMMLQNLISWSQYREENKCL